MGVAAVASGAGVVILPEYLRYHLTCYWANLTALLNRRLLLTTLSLRPNKVVVI